MASGAASEAASLVHRDQASLTCCPQANLHRQTLTSSAVLGEGHKNRTPPPKLPSSLWVSRSTPWSKKHVVLLALFNSFFGEKQENRRESHRICQNKRSKARRLSKWLTIENFPVKHTVNYNCDTLKVFLLCDCDRRCSANSFSDEDYHNNRLSSETKAPSSDEVKVLVWNCEGSAKFVSQSLRFESKFLTENFQRHPEFLRISQRESFRKLRIFDCFDWQFRCSTKSWWPPAMLFIKSQRRKMMTTIISWRYALGVIGLHWRLSNVGMTN